MDVLADALAAMRAGLPRSARTDVRAPWGLRFPEINGMSFHVVVRGSCWLLPTGDRSQPTQLFPGDLVLLRDGSTHALADQPGTPLTDFDPVLSDPASPIGRVELDGPGAATLMLCGAYQLRRFRAHPLMAELPEVIYIPASRGAHPGLRAAIDLLGSELENARPGGAGIVPALVDAMLLYILRAWMDDHDSESHGWASALLDPAVGGALAAIHSDPARRWTVQDLSATVGLARSTFAERFVRLVGTPPLTYLTWWRMTIAERRLRHSSDPLDVLAREVGYASEFAFAKAFKRELGVAPGQYRRAVAPTDTAPSEKSLVRANSRWTG
ncbi:AraC family transcriptional regulator [Kribbella sp. NPDC026596]|uniref:AraC family transcriptional regulator n=1 Tax=Kribbella sp. NPDC026596 TaxID=3155122 RepID=UPI0033D31957